MLWVLPLDLVSIAVYTWVLMAQDALFGACVLLVVSYAVTVPRRPAIMASLAISTAYLVGHAFCPGGHRDRHGPRRDQDRHDRCCRR